MFTILLHSSKTVRPLGEAGEPYQSPALLSRAEVLAEYIKTLSPNRLQRVMHLSAKKAEHTYTQLQLWNSGSKKHHPAIDAFLGDIYSGLQVQDFSTADRAYANDHLLILSGLYGGLKALDSVVPYRLEMGYRLPKKSLNSLYDFWGDSIASLVLASHNVINLSAVEYTKAVLPYLPLSCRVVTPKFLTISQKTGQPEFVTVHAKIARGAFAHWLIKNKVTNVETFKTYSDIGYRYDRTLSNANEPVFVCDQFGGLGLSVRLT